MNQEQRILIEVIRCALGSQSLPANYYDLSPEERRKVILYAKKQALLPFLQYFDIFTKGECREIFFQNLMPGVSWDARLEAEQNTLLEAFEENGIYCIPLKGMRTREWYPSPDLRSMSDLDILYQPRQTEKVKKVMKKLGYEYESEASKHDHYQKPGSVTVEMHKELLPVESVAYEYYRKIWDRSVPETGKQYVWEMSLEDHYIFTFCHLMEHFIRGGIGIRMVLDIYILSQLPEMDWELVEAGLKQIGIEKFEGEIRGLAKFWFSQKNMMQEGRSEQRSENQYAELETYIVNGGVYGDRRNEKQNNTLMYKSGYRYLRKRVFPSYKVMKSMFPWLKSPLLLPAAWVKRYWNVWTKRRRNIKGQWKAAQEMEKPDAEAVLERKQLFEKWGLEHVNKQ